MGDNELMMLGVLIKHYHGSSKHPSLSSLPDDEAQALAGLAIENGDAALAIRQPWEYLLSIHYSWLFEPINHLPRQLVPYVVSSLPSGSKEKVAKHLRLESLPENLTDPFKHLLLDKLYSLLEIKKKTPLEFIPAEPLQELVHLTKNQIVNLIDCLGVYDVATELKQIVDRNQLARIIEGLSPLEQKYLKKAAGKQLRWGGPKLGLDQWGGDKQKLQRALHLRGMMRLGKALKKHHPDFTAHFLLKIDTGRGKQIKKYISQETPDDEVNLLVMDVKETISYIKSHE